MTTRKRSGNQRDAYLELILKFPLRPLRSEEELDAAIKVIDSLLDRDNLIQEERDYLDVLSDLVEKYEADAHPIKPVSDAELLRHLMEAKGVTQTQVARGTNIAVSTISEVLAGRRTLTRNQIGKIASLFHVRPAAFSFESVRPNRGR